MAAFINCTFTLILFCSSLHCSLEDRGNAELLPDCLQIVRFALGFRSRSPRNDLEIADCRQLRQNFILNAFSKVGVGLIVAQVLKSAEPRLLFCGCC